MFLKLFSCVLLLLSLFNIEFSSQTIILSDIESKCNYRCEPIRYNITYPDGDNALTAILKMESRDAFEPILSLELIDYEPYPDHTGFAHSILFEFGEKIYEFRYSKLIDEEAICVSGLKGKAKLSDCTIDKHMNTCKWLMKVGKDGFIGNGKVIELPLIDMIVQPNRTVIELTRDYWHKTVANDLTDLPLYHWSYARCCEYNKKVYDIDGGMITLKKDEDSFELFIYRFDKSRDKLAAQVNLMNSKNRQISISCDGDRNDIIVRSKTGMQDHAVLDKYVLRKHIDSFRCGISLSTEIESKYYSSFSFNDAPLKLFYEFNDSKNILFIQEVRFDSGAITSDAPEIETTTSPASVNENQEHDEVNPVIGFFWRVYDKVKSYFDFG